jgi:hypothetical protein
MISTNGIQYSLLALHGPRWQGSKNRRKIRALITTLLTGLMLMNHEVAAQPAAGTIESRLTCNINGIPSQQRARYVRLVQALRHAIEQKRELSDGFAFQMDTKQIDTYQLIEWIELERLCCPFFGFEVHWDRQNGTVWLHLTGPEGVKGFIRDEFGLR